MAAPAMPPDRLDDVVGAGRPQALPCRRNDRRSSRYWLSPRRRSRASRCAWKPWRPNSLQRGMDEGGAGQVGRGWRRFRRRRVLRCFDHAACLFNRMIKVKGILPCAARCALFTRHGQGNRTQIPGDERRLARPCRREDAIRQFYLAAVDGRSFRVRIRDGSSAVLTLKFGAHGRERDEFEYPIPCAMPRRCWNLPSAW